MFRYSQVVCCNSKVTTLSYFKENLLKSWYLQHNLFQFEFYFDQFYHVLSIIGITHFNCNASKLVACGI